MTIWNNEANKLQGKIQQLTQESKELSKKDKGNKEIKQKQVTVNSAQDKGKSIVPWIVISGIALGEVVFLAFYFKTKKRNNK